MLSSVGSRPALVFGVSLVVLTGGGCAGAAREARQLGSHSIVERTRPLARNQVKRSEIDASSDASGARTLLRFWSALQNGEFESAVGYIDGAYLNAVGASRLLSALRQLTPLWDSSKPTIKVAAIRGGTALVYFNVRDLRGKVGAAEVAFRRVGPTWRISFFSLLPRVSADQRS
jgi:hypothetical protein